MDDYEILRRPIITEKGTQLTTQHKYGFEVASGANKVMVRHAVETIFKVHVTDVNIIHVPSKQRRVGRHHAMTSPWKKAIVTIRPDERIEAFGGA
jgi:large subunit ribosomal protein L23